MNIIELAYAIHERKCDLWRGLPLSEFVPDGDPRIAAPFGRPITMPPHHWRVSRDVMQALTAASPPPYPVDNPKTSHGATKLLLGWPVEVDPDAALGTLSLLVSDGAAIDVGRGGRVNLFDELRGAVIDLPVGRILPGWVAKEAVIAMLDRIEAEHADRVDFDPGCATCAAGGHVIPRPHRIVDDWTEAKR